MDFFNHYTLLLWILGISAFLGGVTWLASWIKRMKSQLAQANLKLAHQEEKQKEEVQKKLKERRDIILKKPVRAIALQDETGSFFSSSGSYRKNLTNLSIQQTQLNDYSYMDSPFGNNGGNNGSKIIKNFLVESSSASNEPQGNYFASLTKLSDNTESIHGPDIYHSVRPVSDYFKQYGGVVQESGSKQSHYVGYSSPKYLMPHSITNPQTDQHSINWNARFQLCTRRLRSMQHSSQTLRSREEANIDLLHLAQDFVDAAMSYGKIIISEHYLPDEKKTIKPQSLPGIIGGEKFVVHNILFKFAVDHKGIYGSDFAAAKAAGNELRGLMCYFNAQIPDLNVPLMALVDYRGFRLTAMSLLPVDTSTIIYGTFDAGKTIHYSQDDIFLKRMKDAAEALRLRPHLCVQVKHRSNPSSEPQLLNIFASDSYTSQSRGSNSLPYSNTSSSTAKPGINIHGQLPILKHVAGFGDLSSYTRKPQPIGYEGFNLYERERERTPLLLASSAQKNAKGRKQQIPKMASHGATDESKNPINNDSIHPLQHASSSSSIHQANKATGSPPLSTSNMSSSSPLDSTSDQPPPSTLNIDHNVSFNNQLMYSPVDLEGHKGLDGKYYLLDFSRVLPPESPNKQFQNPHLSRLLRPEFLKQYSKELCSDAFSGFIQGTPDEDEITSDIYEATRYLKETHIPKMSHRISEMMRECKMEKPLSKFRLTEAMHSMGINCKYAGILRKHVQEPDFKQFILAEVVARAIKNNLRWRLREQHQLLKLPLEEPYLRLIIDFLNLVFGNTLKSDEFWEIHLKKDIMYNFDECLDEFESSIEFPLKARITPAPADPVISSSSSSSLAKPYFNLYYYLPFAKPSTASTHTTPTSNTPSASLINNNIEGNNSVINPQSVPSRTNSSQSNDSSSETQSLYASAQIQPLDSSSSTPSPSQLRNRNQHTLGHNHHHSNSSPSPTSSPLATHHHSNHHSLLRSPSHDDSAILSSHSNLNQSSDSSTSSASSTQGNTGNSGQVSLSSSSSSSSAPPQQTSSTSSLRSHGSTSGHSRTASTSGIPTNSSSSSSLRNPASAQVTSPISPASHLNLRRNPAASGGHNRNSIDGEEGQGLNAAVSTGSNLSSSTSPSSSSMNQQIIGSNNKDDSFSGDFSSSSSFTPPPTPLWTSRLDGNFVTMVFERVKAMMGLQFTHDRSYSWEMESPFNDTDLKNVGYKVKHMNIISHVQGFFWQINGLMARSSSDAGLASEYYKSAIDKYEEALDLSPENKDVLRNLALTWLLLIDETTKPGQPFPAEDRRVQKVHEYIMRAISSHPKYDSLSLFRYANLLSRCNKKEEAEDYYLQSLEADPNNTGCLHEYGSFLSSEGLEEDAEAFYRRSSMTTAGATHFPENYY